MIIQSAFIVLQYLVIPVIIIASLFAWFRRLGSRQHQTHAGHSKAGQERSQRTLSRSYGISQPKNVRGLSQLSSADTLPKQWT